MTPTNIPAMSPAQAQIQLADIHLAEPVGQWPPAMGWIIIATLLALGLAGLIFWLLRRHKLKRMSRLACRHLKEQSDLLDLQALNELLKVTAMHYAASESLAGLSGKRWHQWLEQHTPAKHKKKIAHLIQLFKTQQYQQTSLSTEQKIEALAAANIWLVHAWRLQKSSSHPTQEANA